MSKLILQNFGEVETNVDVQNEAEERELTVIHFITRPDTVKYSAGWWVMVEPTIFIRPVGSKDKLGLVYALNIPTAPQKYYFSNKTEQLHFTLFFPALPKDTTHIDIIEVEGGSTQQFFNYYNVPMSEINRMPLKH